MEPFFEKICLFCSGKMMTAISGIFMAASFCMMMGWLAFPVDPAWGAILVSGGPIVFEAVKELLRRRKITSDLLVASSIAASVFIGEVFAAGEVAFIMAVGEILETMTIDRAKKGVTHLLSLAPVKARRIFPAEEMVSASEVREGDLVRILPGEIIPADGQVISGITSVNQSVMTGESLPVDKEEGDSVFSGTVNCFGAIDIRVTKDGENSSFQKLVRLVREAEERKAPMQLLADRWAERLVPLSLAIAICLYLFNIQMGLDMAEAMERSVTILVVFCPCALVLATPTAIVAAIGQAAKRGILIKSGESLEKMEKVHTMVFDKTGTLTYGKPIVSDVEICDPALSERELLSLAAAVEQRSEHPLGKAVLEFAEKRGISVPEADSFVMKAGSGVHAQVRGISVDCGNERFFMEKGIDLSGKIRETLSRLQGEGKGIILVAVQGKAAGVIALCDEARNEAESVISSLSGMGVHSVLLTGDHGLAATYFAKKVGISSVRADLLPGDKAACIGDMEAQGEKTCMLGDGVNDAPALKTAHVGIAMGNMGSGIAVEAADIALMRDDISQVAYLKKLSAGTVKTIRKNIAASMAVNGIAVALAMTGVLDPVSGALVHNLGSVLVIFNAALLYDRHFETA